MKKTFLAFLLATLFGFLTFPAAAANLTPAGPNEALVLMQDLGLWKDKFGGGLDWVEGLTIGDKVTLLGQTSKFKQDGREKDFTKVKAVSGKEGWVRSNFIASNASLGVVKADKASIYSEPRDIKITARTIPQMTVIAIFKDGSNDSFLKVTGYDAANDTLNDQVFLSVDDVTSSVYDVNAVVLYTVALTQKNKEIKKNLLNVAITKYGSTIFFDKIQSALPDFNPAAPKPSKAFSGKFVLNDDNVNVRATPDEKNGTVVKALNKGTEVEAIEVTQSSYNVAGNSAPWYKIKEPAGWIFGAFLDPAE